MQDCPSSWATNDKRNLSIFVNANDPPNGGSFCFRSCRLTGGISLLGHKHAELFSALHGCENTNLADGADGLGRDTKGHPTVFLWNEETLPLKVGVETTLRPALRVRNIVSHQNFLSCNLTNAAHGSEFRIAKKQLFPQSSNPGRPPFLMNSCRWVKTRREARWTMRARCAPNRWHHAIAPSGPATAIHTVPTGLSSVPPPGPATPEVAIAQVVPMALRAPIAIAFTTGSLTAPWSSMSLESTSKKPVFTALS